MGMYPRNVWEERHNELANEYLAALMDGEQTSRPAWMIRSSVRFVTLNYVLLFILKTQYPRSEPSLLYPRSNLPSLLVSLSSSLLLWLTCQSIVLVQVRLLC